MTHQLLPVGEQVIVITGASSGIGLVTAKRAAARGARVVLAARNENDLRTACDEIRVAGGRAIFVAADVSDPKGVAAIADAAMAEFGRIDAWVNNAASALADRAIPLQGIYCAAKHAIKAFTDALRMELEADGVPISVSLVKPASIDTPFFEKAKTYLDVEPQPVPPVYAPEIAADVILRCAETPTREIIAGGAAEKLRLAQLFPRVADKVMERRLFDQQHTAVPVGNRPDNLYGPVKADGGERGHTWHGRTRETSVLTWAAMRPAAAVAGLVALMVGAVVVANRVSPFGPPRL